MAIHTFQTRLQKKCHLCKQCQEHWLEPCLGSSGIEKCTKSLEANSSGSNCSSYTSKKLMRCSICHVGIPSEDVQYLPFENLMKNLHMAHLQGKKQNNPEYFLAKYST